MAKIGGLTVDKVEDKKPIKAGSTHRDDTGGIFTRKIVAIWKKIFGR